jgi:hypothetical protein
MSNIIKLYRKSPVKHWIKLIDTSNSMKFKDYHRKKYFTRVAGITLDTDLNKSGKKKRNTVIKFVPTISNELFKRKTEWLYLFTINGCIVKIGGTRTGIKSRASSYLCGHYIRERNKSGDCSKTNGFIYNTFEFYLKLGYKIEMYGYQLPKTEFTIDIFGKQTKVSAQTYHAYESTFLSDYKKTHGKYPQLCDNCDPDYKN